MILEFISVLVLTILLCFILLKWKHQYWKRKGVPQLSPHIIFGDMEPLFTGSTSFKDFTIDVYKTAKSAGYKYVGLYAFVSPHLLVIDVNLVKRILSQDFDHFFSRASLHHKFSELTHNLLAMDGMEWRDRRKKLTPLFTTGKMLVKF